jgi:hypothetical protein
VGRLVFDDYSGSSGPRVIVTDLASPAYTLVDCLLIIQCCVRRS